MEFSPSWDLKLKALAMGTQTNVLGNNSNGVSFANDKYSLVIGV